VVRTGGEHWGLATVALVARWCAWVHTLGRPARTDNVSKASLLQRSNQALVGAAHRLDCAAVTKKDCVPGEGVGAEVRLARRGGRGIRLP